MGLMNILQVAEQGLTRPFGDERTVQQAFPAGIPTELADPFLMCDYFNMAETKGKAAGGASSQGQDRKLPARSASTKKRRFEEKETEDRTRTLRPRSTKAARTTGPLPIVGQMISHQVAPRDDEEDQSVLTIASTRSPSIISPHKPAKPAVSSKKPPSKSKHKKAPRGTKHLIFPHDMVGLKVDFPDDGEGEIVEAMCKDIGYKDAELTRSVRFKIQFEDGILEKSFHKTADFTKWHVRNLVDHEGPSENNEYKVRISWKALKRFAHQPTWETLEYAATLDREACIKYAQEKKLLDEPGWAFLLDSEQEGDDLDASSDDDDDESSASEDQPGEKEGDDKVAYKEDDSEATEEVLEVDDDNEFENNQAVAVSQDGSYTAGIGFDMPIEDIQADRPDEQTWDE